MTSLGPKQNILFARVTMGFLERNKENKWLSLESVLTKIINNTNID